MIVAVAGLVWAIRSGQFDDMEGPAHRILMDDDDPRIPGQRDKSRNSLSKSGGKSEGKSDQKAERDHLNDKG